MILKHAQNGSCDADDIAEVTKLVLTEPDCTLPNFNNNLWDKVVLVTPRHGVQNPWNQAAMGKHYAKTSNVLWTFNTEDTVRKECNPLCMGERVIVAGTYLIVHR